MTLKVQVTPVGPNGKKARVFTASAADTPETVKNAIGGVFLKYPEARAVMVDALVNEGHDEAARELLALLKTLGA